MQIYLRFDINTAENVARKYAISRKMQDALAPEAHRRAANAIAKGYFREQILPIAVPSKKGEIIIDTDEHVRLDASAADFAKLKPVFVKESSTVTAGNASGINDAAAAVVLMEREVAQKRYATPLARLVAYAHAGVDPAYMGIGPVAATRKVLERARLSIDDFDVIEAEAFAAQARAVAQGCACERATECSYERATCTCVSSKLDGALSEPWRRIVVPIKVVEVGVGAVLGHNQARNLATTMTASITMTLINIASLLLPTRNP